MKALINWQHVVFLLLLSLVAGMNSAMAQAASGTPITQNLQQSTANPRLVRITHGDAKGTILASVAPGVLYKSTDEGATFTKLAEITYQSGVTWDCCGVLYEMPSTVGSLPVGTLLFAADYCDGTSLSINIYSSSDDGTSWSYLSTPVSGGPCVKKGSGEQGVPGEGVWEPEFELASNGALVMFWSDETDPCCSQKLSQIRTFDGATWRDKRNTVALGDHAARPGMAVVSKLPSGKYFMTYELCGTAACAAMYRTSADGWDFGPPSKTGTRITTASGRYFEHAPRNIWLPSEDSGDRPFPANSRQGKLLVVGQVLHEKDGAVSGQDGEILFENASEDGSGKWKSIPAPVKVPSANITGTDVCQNYSSSLLPVQEGLALLEMASDWNSAGKCTSYYATGRVPHHLP